MGERGPGQGRDENVTVALAGLASGTAQTGPDDDKEQGDGVG